MAGQIALGFAGLNLIFCGTPEFAVPTLRKLLAESFSIRAVVTQPDRPRGRGQKVASSPVKEVALEHNVHVYQPERIREPSAREFIERAEPDAVVIIAYGQIIPADLLTIPKYGWINLHASLLPKYRGAAPVQWAIVNGETRTGITSMRIDPGMDTGPILLQEEVEITPDDTAETLATRLSTLGADLMVKTLRGLKAGTISERPQDHSLATYAPRIQKEQGRLDWNLTAQQIHNRIRGLVPWPGAHTSFRGQLCHLWRSHPESGSALGKEPGTITVESGRLRVICGGSLLRVEELQLENRKRVSALDFINGTKLVTGEKFV
jgi:methionyl-tRNA formyltransferase